MTLLFDSTVGVVSGAVYLVWLLVTRGLMIPRTWCDLPGTTSSLDLERDRASLADRVAVVRASDMAERKVAIVRAGIEERPAVMARSVGRRSACCHCRPARSSRALRSTQARHVTCAA